MRDMTPGQYEILRALVKCKNRERGMWQSSFYKLCKSHGMTVTAAIKSLDTLVYFDDPKPRSRSSVNLISRKRAIIALKTRKIPERGDL